MPPRFIYCDDYYADIGQHVFPTEKFGLLAERLVEEGIVRRGEFLEPTDCTREDLLLVHTPEYLDDLYACRPGPGTRRSELPLSPEIVRAYTLGAGGTVLACEQALEHGAAMNLTGGFHHCFPDHAEGFCYVNDIAVAIVKMQQLGRIGEAAVIDCDLHQGNGTAVVFQSDPSVFTFSIHQERLYPAKQKSDLDIGLDDLTDDAAYLERLHRAAPRILDEFAPQLVVYQAGVDPFAGDVLGSLSLSKAGILARDRFVLTECHARGIPVAVTLGGGYAADLDDTVDMHLNTCKALVDVWSPDDGAPTPRSSR